ncbi:unnamed protein product [Rotaria sp. Silwood1]|nr:unnamed protein product [Rotaria sp. Silwood1]CAF1684251.1 unnamed protein product [Rotaria sp. Silwood1]CAF3912427.1 unnamed protein product [Rotaria sp. Silwood1]CAF3933445.1 unnamed protein product [Rotaria sp. Silwood1]CAF4007762.1 unnamed protein product [Rotaria sp. Silwood1]
MPTKFEHLSVELLYEIFIYFQYDEIFNIFCNLNSRFATIIDNLSTIPIYLGFDRMTIGLTQFYYKYLSKSNISNRLISLFVSDTLSMDNGLWLSSNLSRFINLRNLCLIDIKRCSFELIL